MDNTDRVCASGQQHELPLPLSAPQLQGGDDDEVLNVRTGSMPVMGPELVIDADEAWCLEVCCGRNSHEYVKPECCLDHKLAQP